MKNILITGGAGFIGSRLCEKLFDQGNNITVLDNLSEQIHGNEESFLFLLANKFEWHLRKNHQKSDIGRLFNNAVDILKDEKDFVIVKSSEKKAQIVWGLSEWEKKRIILEKEAIEKLKIKFPSYAHLKKVQNPNSDKSAPLISNNDLQKMEKHGKRKI